MAPKKQVSPAIRISQGERDASARATHLEAATRKFLVTTNERKQMSTKTNFKRIALVAVAALGLGLLSSVPSQAAPTGTSITVRNQGTAALSSLAATTVYSDSSTAAKFTLTALMTAATDTVAVTFVEKSTPAGSTAVARLTYHDTGTAVSTGVVSSDIQGTTNLTLSAGHNRADSVLAGTSLFMKASTNNTYASAGFRISLDSMTATAKVGTYTYTVVATPYTTNVAGLAITQDITIVVSDPATAAAAAVAAGGTSKAIMSSGTAFDTADIVDDAVAAAFTPSASVPVAVIRVTQLTSDSLAARESITATITIGNLGTTTAAQGKSLILQPDSDGTLDIGVFPDGTSGTATISIKTKSVTFADKQVNFFSTTVSKFEVTRLVSVLGSGSSNALLVKAIDASGNVIKESTNSTVYAYSDNLDAIATGATTASGTACSAYNAAVDGSICALSGSANGSAKITIRNKSTLALSTVASTTTPEITVNLNPAAKVALSFDKATYAPGEVAYLSVVATDAAGKAVGPNTGYANLLATGGVTSNVAFGNGSASTDSMTATTLVLSTATTGRVSDVGIYTLKVYMPSSGGTITATATGGTALPAANQVKVTATATVTDNGAAALAAVNALATTVASLRTLITTLTNLVLKIQKKVKA
jgi:trimeric autotransporter adhesin